MQVHCYFKSTLYLFCFAFLYQVSSIKHQVSIFIFHTIHKNTSKISISNTSKSVINNKVYIKLINQLNIHDIHIYQNTARIWREKAGRPKRSENSLPLYKSWVNKAGQEKATGQDQHCTFFYFFFLFVFVFCFVFGTSTISNYCNTIQYKCSPFPNWMHLCSGLCFQKENNKQQDQTIHYQKLHGESRLFYFEVEAPNGIDLIMLRDSSLTFSAKIRKKLRCVFE